MTEQFPSSIGTVAQEAARLIEDMATMARSSYRGDDGPGPHQGKPVPEPDWPEPPNAGGPTGDRQPGDGQGKGERSNRTCSQCGSQGGATAGHDSFSTCKICPLCRGIDVLRSVRPETMDMLADLAMSVAGSLRDVAVWSRASDPSPRARPGSGGSPDPGRAPVQDIPVDDEGEGSRW